MKHRLPLSLISFLTTVLAILASIFVPHLAAADTPPTDSFTVVGQTADGQPIVEVNPGASINALVQRYAARYKATTGEDLTWQIIYAANPKQIIPNCITPPAGQPHWLGRGVESVWEGCAEKDKTAGLVAGASAHITIPLAHVETYEERVARYTAADACLKDVDCLKGKLADLGVTTTPTNDKELVSLKGQVKNLTAENDALKASLAKVPTPEPVPSTDSPEKSGKTPSVSSHPPVSFPIWGFGLVGALGLVVTSFAAGKTYQKRRQAKTTAIVPVRAASMDDGDEPEPMSVLPDGPRDIATYTFKVPDSIAASAKTKEMKESLLAETPEQENRALRAQNEELTRKYNALLDENRELKAENAVLRRQPPPQVVITGGQIVVATSADASSRETRPEINPIVTPAPKPASFVPVTPTFGPPPVSPPVATPVSFNEAELEAQIEEDREALTKCSSFEPDKMVSLGNRIQRNEAALKALRAPRESIPDLGPVAPLKVERDSVPDHRITLPELRMPAAPPSLSQQEREIAELKQKLHEQGERYRKKRRILERAARVYLGKHIQRQAQGMLTRHLGRLRGQPIDTQDIELAFALEHEIGRAELAEQQVAEVRQSVAASAMYELRQERDTLAAWKKKMVTQTVPAFQRYRASLWGRIEQLTADLEGAHALNETLDVKEYLRLQFAEQHLMGALGGTEWRFREISAGHTAAIAALKGLTEKRDEFKVTWSQVRELIDELAEAKASKRDTHTFIQLLDQQFASVDPLFQELTGVGLTDVMLAPRNAEPEEPPPSERTIRRASLPPKVPHFDAEETYVPDGNDPPRSTRNGNGRVHTRDYPIVPADSRSSAPEIEVHEGGTNGLPSPNDLANDIKNAQLLDAFTDDKLPAELVLTRRAVHCFKKLLMVPTRYSRELFTSQPHETADELCAQRQDLLTGMNQLEKMGIFAKKTLLPRSNLGSPFGDPHKNGA